MPRSKQGNAPAPTTLEALLPKFAMDLNISGQSAKKRVQSSPGNKPLKYFLKNSERWAKSSRPGKTPTHFDGSIRLVANALHNHERDFINVRFDPSVRVRHSTCSLQWYRIEYIDSSEKGYRTVKSQKKIVRFELSHCKSQ